MPSHNLAVRLSVIDGDKVKAEITDIGQKIQQGLGQATQAAKPASDGLDKVAKSAEGIGRATPGIANLGNVVAGFVGGLAAGAVQEGLRMLSRIPQLFSEMVQAAQEAQESQRRLEAVLRATGGTAGFTAEQLGAFANAQERSTLATAESVQDAAAVLATFRSVSGETFTRTISLAQDMASVFKGDLQSSVQQLGKALEDPIAGLNLLQRSYKIFTDAQREAIKEMVESGRIFEAQQAILSAVEERVGGAAAGQQAGVTGATNRLADAWGNLLEELGKTDAVTSGVSVAFNTLAAGLEGLANDVAGQTSSIEERFRRAQETLANIRAYREEHPIASLFRVPGTESIAEAQVEALRGPAQENLRIRLLTQEAEERATAIAVEQQQQEIKTNAVLEQRKGLEEELVKLRRDPGERTAQIQADLEKTRQRLESARTPGSGDEVDKAIATAEEIARRRTAIVEEQAARERASEERRGESAARAAEREVTARQRATEQKIKSDEQFLQASISKEAKELDAVQNLEDAYAKLANTQMANIDLVLQRQLEANAREIEDIAHREAADVAATQRAEEEKARLRQTTLAGTHQEALTARLGKTDIRARESGLGDEERTSAMREGMEIRVQLERNETAARLAQLTQVGLAEEDYARAREDIIAASQDRISAIQSKTNQDMERGLVSMSRMADSFVSTFSGGIAELVIAGREGFDSLGDAFQTFLDGMQRQLIQQGVQAAIGSPGPGGGGLLGALFGSAAASGGGGGTASSSGSGSSIQGWQATWAHTGSPGVPIIAPASLWKDAPRYHSGHTPSGLAPWERAAIIRRDETILTPSQMAEREPNPINVSINNYSQENVTTRQDPRGGMQIDIGTVFANALSKPGSPAHQAVRGLIQNEMRSGA